MTQVISQQVKKHYEEKPVQRVRGSPGAFYVRSENPKKQQLWYKVVLRENEMYCACEFFKFRKEVCKHLFRVMALYGGVV
jgi:hypothetical protein